MNPLSGRLSVCTLDMHAFHKLIFHDYNDYEVGGFTSSRSLDPLIVPVWSIIATSLHDLFAHP